MGHIQSGRDEKFPRQLAVRILTRVLSQHEPLDEAFSQLLAELSVHSKSASNAQTIAWLQDVCSGTLRWKGRLDAIIDAAALRKKPSGWLRKCLLIAAYQLVVQDRVHPGAVVSETVSEIKSREGEAPARFANACLRKIASHAKEWRAQSFPEQEYSEHSWASLPEWLWKKLKYQHGLEWAKAYAQASLERPFLWIRVQDAQWKPDQNVSITPGLKTGWIHAGPLLGSWRVEEGGAVDQLPGFSDGKFIVQDISSQLLIAEATCAIRKCRAEGTLALQSESYQLQALELCAAPGGKSVGMAWNGVQVFSTDRLKHRVPLLQQTISRVAPQIQFIPWDQLEALGAKEWVWLDAPCSGTGIIRRHPDVRWLRGEKELYGLQKTQEELFRKAWDHVLPSGFLVYSVCSVLKEEGPGLIERIGVQNQVLRSWLLCPQDPPYGDGFWAVLLQKCSGA